MVLIAAGIRRSLWKHWVFLRGPQNDDVIIFLGMMMIALILRFEQGIIRTCVTKFKFFPFLTFMTS